jgi:hypothetical protein
MIKIIFLSYFDLEEQQELIGQTTPHKNRGFPKA